MNTRFYSEIENSFTSSRLSVYKQYGADNLTCLARYLYNIEVCKSLYSSVNIFEVTFRNAIDKVLCTVAGADNWYDILTLDSTSMKNISDAKHKIQKKGKPVTHDRIVSELTFGFWTSLLTPRYSQASFQSKIIKTCFKGVPAAQRNIKNLQARFDKIRILRNRVSHHERIIHWKNLSIQHDELLESIKWLDNASYELACSCDKFPKVYAKDFKAYKQYVKRHWNKY